MLETIKKYRRDLHQIPELELDLPETTNYILSVLEEFDCIVSVPLKSTIFAYFDNQKEHTLAFRSDMDALPVTEQTNLEFKSKNPGKMHACGHDGHMAMLLGFAKELNTYYKTLDKNILLIFQPGEESPGGAHLICEDNILKKYHVQYIFGTHLWPVLEKGVVATRKNEFMARASEINIDIYGKESHAAKYKEGIDALEIGAEILLEIYAMEKEIPNEYYRLLRFGRMESGTVRNVISGHTRLEGTLRAFQDYIFDSMKEEIFRICADKEKKYNCKVNISINTGYPAVMNDEKLVSDLISKIPEIRQLRNPEMIAEDFAYYQKEVPGVFFFLGTQTPYALHNAKFDFDEEVLLSGIELYKKIAKCI